MSKKIALAGVVLLGLGLLHCGKTADEPTDAGTGADSGAGPGADSGSGSDASASDGSSDATTVTDATSPPKVSCGEDASVCDTIPPSVCSPTVSTTVIYFSGGTCVDGACTWKQSSMECGSQSYCLDGACTPPTTK
jgi:hypothetical protein